MPACYSGGMAEKLMTQRQAARLEHEAHRRRYESVATMAAAVGKKAPRSVREASELIEMCEGEYPALIPLAPAPPVDWEALEAFIATEVWEEEREEFRSWSHKVLEQTPLLALQGWENLWKDFHSYWLRSLYVD